MHQRIIEQVHLLRLVARCALDLVVGCLHRLHIFLLLVVLLALNVMNTVGVADAIFC